MGFSTQDDRQASPAKLRYVWSGAEHLDEGKYRFSFYDREQEKNIEVKLPFEFWFLENTIGIGGGGDGYYYWTNEAAPATWESPGTTMTLHKTTFLQDGSRSNEILVRGTYAQIKEALGFRDKTGRPALPQDMKYIQNYYFLNPETKEIECFRMQGSANSAFISFTSANKGWGQKKTRMSVDPELKHRGSIYYYEPQFEIAGEYNDEELELMRKADKEVLDYIKSLYEQGGQAEGVDPTLDQTPKTYDGEQSQERSEPEQASESLPDDVDLSGVPF